MARWARNITFLLLIGTSFENIGLVGHDLYRLLSILSFLVFLSTFLPLPVAVRALGIRRLLTAVFLAVIGMLAAWQTDLGLFYFYLFFAIPLLVVFWTGEAANGREFASYVLALACVGILAEMVRIFPFLWHLQSKIAAILSFAAEKIAREDRNLSATALGLPLLVSLVVLGMVRELTARDRGRYRLIGVVALLVGAHVCYVVLLKYYARCLAGYPGWDWLLLNCQHLFLVIGATVYTFADRSRTRFLDLRFHRRVLAASAVALGVAVIAAALFGWAPAPRHGPAKVMIYDAGYVDWKIPVHGVYGERSAGMFGLLPPALEATGYRPVLSADLGLLEGSGAPDCLVMINVQRFFDQKDKERIWRYIARGGGVLCLGDHTGVAGIRGPFNDLLKPVGIRFQFDSSTFFGEGWNDALAYRCHPMNRGVKNAEDYQIWVGATLDLDVSARPVVVARYGYSDIGDPSNIERSYLGDRRYNPSERLGDIVLAADARYGKGKVMVFGDTSGYQNLSLARSLDTVAWSIDYLAAKGGFAPGLKTQIAAIVSILLVLIVTVSYARHPLPIAAAALGFAAASAFVHVLTPPPARLTPDFARVRPAIAAAGHAVQKRDVAVIDVSHGGYFTLRAWKDKSIGGFQLNLARNGYFPLLRDEFPSRDLLAGTKLLVAVAPSRRYTEKEIDAVENFLKNGGKMIVSVGFEELDGCRSLLNRFGIDVANIPLGHFDVETPPDTLSVTVHEGWPVRFDRTSPTDVLLSKWELPLAVRRQIGKGEIIVIGDSSFFHDNNLETLKSYFAGNIAFLRKITETSHPQ
jgi:hypothetical protein